MEEIRKILRANFTAHSSEDAHYPPESHLFGSMSGVEDRLH
jgi:hypothetical protein